VIERKDATEDQAGFQTNPGSATSRELLVLVHTIERSVPRMFVGTRNQVEANLMAGPLAEPAARWMLEVKTPWRGVISQKRS
jgi:hypothetical protein